MNYASIVILIGFDIINRIEYGAVRSVHFAKLQSNLSFLESSSWTCRPSVARSHPHHISTLAISVRARPCCRTSVVNLANCLGTPEALPTCCCGHLKDVSNEGSLGACAVATVFIAWRLLEIEEVLSRYFFSVYHAMTIYRFFLSRSAHWVLVLIQLIFIYVRRMSTFVRSIRTVAILQA